jgi:hypothetical protein
VRRLTGGTGQRCFSEVNALSLRRLKASQRMWRLRAQGFAFGLALDDAAVEVVARLGLVFGANDGDGVDGVAGLAV